MSDSCYVRIKKEWVKAEYIGIYQYSKPVDRSPMVGGYPGGVLVYPIVVAKLDGEFREFLIGDVKFEEESQ